ncbi:hypothetical protein [Chitinilyticum litopenaei]|uniref:hypothetical protein n=1 Tax=Chitinilyticum litopenaei TaxID=1121276 RepID=UPI0004247A23|nr:hypothetical protein [Chitinilyticum litopenaei]
MSGPQKEPRRFGLDVIDEQQAALAAAKKAAMDKEANRSSGRLAALANLPIMIVAVIWALWYFFWR